MNVGILCFEVEERNTGIRRKSIHRQTQERLAENHAENVLSQLCKSMMSDFRSLSIAIRDSRIESENYNFGATSFSLHRTFRTFDSLIGCFSQNPVLVTKLSGRETLNLSWALCSKRSFDQIKRQRHREREVRKIRRKSTGADRESSI